MSLYVFPLTGLLLLALGGWSNWRIWWSEHGHWPAPPGLAWRLAALLLGVVWGWRLVNLEYPCGPGQVAIGVPLPVLTLQRNASGWYQPAGSASGLCVAVDVATGICLATLALHAGWKLLERWQGARRPKPYRRPRTA